jgi:protein-L-isoaspartate(D-aspartate) O-methyltransferase
MGASEERARMVEAHLAGRGIKDARILAAFGEVPREEFVDEKVVNRAYEDSPLEIADGQTISQPYVVALTADALQLRGGERLLDVGTGSGYAAAIVSRLVAQVYSIERIEALANTARARLARLGYDNVHVRCGDGTLGWEAHAPYEAIAVAASAPRVPVPLARQLAIGGRLVIPVGDNETSQVLLRVTREGPEQFREEKLLEVRFVPLIGERGWAAR